MIKKVIALFLLGINFYNNSENNAPTFHRYLWANYKQFSGDTIQANNWYEQLFSSKRPTYSYKGYVSFLTDTRQFKKIVDLIPRLQDSFVADPDIQILFFNALEQTKNHTQAENLIITLSQRFKTHPEITLQASQTYMRRKELENALITINNFLNNTPHKPNNFVFYFLRSNIHIQLSQYTQALNDVKKCLEIHPSFDKGWLLYANLHEKQGTLEEAIAGYSTLLEIVGSNTEIEKHIYALTLKRNQFNQMKHALVSKKPTLNNALILSQHKNYPQALIELNKCIAQSPDNVDAKLLKIETLSAMKKINEAAQSIAEWAFAEPANELWLKTLYLLTYNGLSYKDALCIFDTIIERNPNAWKCHLYKADIYMRIHNNTAAINSLEKTISVSIDPVLKSSILYQLSILYYQQVNYPKMYEYLTDAYSLNQNCPHIANALAYYWATKGKDLNKAHQLLDKALNKAPQNPYFLDTKALILYKEKKYTQALEILEKIADTENSTILLHLAKVHYALNNKEIAGTFTQKAQALAEHDCEKKSLIKMNLRLAQI